MPWRRLKSTKRPTAAVKALLPVLILALSAPLVHAQLGADTVGQGEFPALQLLPPGSVVKGITLPRYLNHRVVSLFRSAELKVLTRSEVQLAGIRAEMYAATGETTHISTPQVHYSFRTEIAAGEGDTTVTDPRFTARGTGVTFSATRQCGLLRGPVHTTVSTGLFENKKK